jgi:hypothetical protein
MISIQLCLDAMISYSRFFFFFLFSGPDSPLIVDMYHEYKFYSFFFFFLSLYPSFSFPFFPFSLGLTYS